MPSLLKIRLAPKATEVSLSSVMSAVVVVILKALSCDDRRCLPLSTRGLLTLLSTVCVSIVQETEVTRGLRAEVSL